MTKPSPVKKLAAASQLANLFSSTRGDPAQIDCDRRYDGGRSEVRVQLADDFRRP
jgi:hypothetical protein